MLKRCRDQFQHYGDLHMRKDPPQWEKAATNYALVAEINRATLALISPPLVTTCYPAPTCELRSPPHLLRRDYVGSPDTTVETPDQ